MNYFGQWSNLELLRQDGTTRLAREVLQDVPYVVLLFSASWHAEAEKFFPLLEQFYRLHHESKGFEVIYISRDYNKAEMLHGFLSKERAITAEKRQQRRERNESGKQLHPPPSSSTSALQKTVQQGGTSGLRGTNVDGTSDREGGDNAASSSPPPLKRVAELQPGKATNNFSGTLMSPTASHASRLHVESGSCGGGGGGFWAVPYDYVGVVGVPILYHLRVFSYPGVVVCRNKPLDPSVVPQLLPPLRKLLPVQERETSVAGAAAAAPTDVENAPRRRQNTPMVARRVCYPDVVTIAGRFMLETGDPNGHNFPWAHMGSQVRCAALLFFTIVIATAAVVLSVVLPAAISMMQAKKAAAAATAASARVH
jgi:hypothetical protein